MLAALLALPAPPLAREMEVKEPAKIDYLRELLALAKEPASIRNNEGDEHIRFIFTQSFSVPLIVRVTRRGDQVILRSIFFTGAETGRVHVVKTKALSMKDWKLLEALAENGGFWKLPFEDAEMAMDGTDWFFEAFRDGKYHSAKRSTATAGAAERNLAGYIALARQMVNLAPAPHRLELR